MNNAAQKSRVLEHLALIRQILGTETPIDEVLKIARRSKGLTAADTSIQHHPRVS